MVLATKSGPPATAPEDDDASSGRTSGCHRAAERICPHRRFFSAVGRGRLAFASSCPPHRSGPHMQPVSRASEWRRELRRSRGQRRNAVLATSPPLADAVSSLRVLIVASSCPRRRLVFVRRCSYAGSRGWRRVLAEKEEEGAPRMQTKRAATTAGGGTGRGQFAPRRAAFGGRRLVLARSKVQPRDGTGGRGGRRARAEKVDKGAPRVASLNVVVLGFGGVEPHLASPLSPGLTSDGSEVGGSCPAKRAADDEAAEVGRSGPSRAPRSRAPDPEVDPKSAEGTRTEAAAIMAMVPADFYAMFCVGSQRSSASAPRYQGL
ncbi:hypothetical protein ACHAWF_017029, partial [Thalassiosira exigua]